MALGVGALALAALLLTDARRGGDSRSTEVAPLGAPPASPAGPVGSPVPHCPDAGGPAQLDSGDAEDRPSYTPFTVPPVIQNRDEAEAVYRREYARFRDQGIRGMAVVALRIDEQGIVRKARIDGSGCSPEVDDAALRVVEAMRFTPGMDEQGPIPVWLYVPVRFPPAGEEG